MAQASTADMKKKAPVPKQKRERNAVKVRGKIMEAALSSFARNGYNGSTMRAIARDAGVTIQLLVYHVKSKENLWKMVVTDLVQRFEKMHEIAARQDSEELDTAGEIRRLIADTVYYFAELPEIHRLMTHEADQLTPRLVWLIEHFSSKSYQKITELFVTAEKEGIVIHADPWRWYYAIVSLTAVPFAVSAEYEYLTGKRPDSQGEIERHTDFITQLILRE